MIDKILRFYQKYLSIFSHGSCRYIPTCSEYARWQFDNNSFFKAIYFTITRILSCNKLFDGGFHYPKTPYNENTFYLIKTHEKYMPKQIHKIKYWYVPTKNKTHCLITKNWEYEK